MRGHVYNVPRGLVWDMVLGVEEREREVIASKRERELRSMAGRESRPRERVCSVSLSLQKGVSLGLTLILLPQYLTLLKSTFKSDS